MRRIEVQIFTPHMGAGPITNPVMPRSKDAA